MIIALKVITLLLVAVTMALSLAHALELPGKLRLTREQYLVVQPIYYPGFTYAGICEPLAVLALALLLALTPSGTSAFWLTAAALTAAAVTHLLYWILTAPVNKVWLKDEKLSGGAKRFFGADNAARANDDWLALGDRWEKSHVLRAVSSIAAFMLLAIAISS